MPTIRADDVIEELGGCGRFQVRLGFTVHLTKSLACFSFLSMIFITATPNWWCARKTDDTSWNRGNQSLVLVNYNETYDNSTVVDERLEKTCAVNLTSCESIRFSLDVRTLVSEFELVCDLSYVPSMIISLQTCGVLLGGPIAGQISDSIGRKPPYFAAISIILIFNFVGFLSTGWIMFAVTRFFVGIGAGAFLSVQHCILTEITLSKWRPWITGFPSWPIEGCLLALVSWLIKDWRYIQLFCTLWALPFLLTWFVIPESFRWFVAHDRGEDAERVVQRWAKINKRPPPVMDTLIEGMTKTENEKDPKYTFLHLFMSRAIARTTILLSTHWLAFGLIFYGITYGIQALSGNIYLNLFLFSLTSIPAKVVDLWIQNKLGRKVSIAICFTVVTVGGIIVGFVQATDAPHQDVLTNVFAMLAYIGINVGWGPVQTIALELYPTVIRNIGVGYLNMVARVGAIIGPQLIYLNAQAPGLMYFICGGISIVVILSLLGLPETRDSTLQDKM